MNRWISRFDQRELAVCTFFNRACRRPRIEKLFAFISRLGDGVFWYALMLALPVFQGKAALPAVVDMGTVGIVNVLVYKFLKGRTVRSRPFAANSEIHLGAMPLDEYSFPSGHTLHAVAFTLVASSYYPELAWVLVPFAFLVAASRVILGLHYPSDVLAGAALGTVLAQATLSL